jgi:hypothetical protein
MNEDLQIGYRIIRVRAGLMESICPLGLYLVGIVANIVLLLAATALLIYSPVPCIGYTFGAKK